MIVCWDNILSCLQYSLEEIARIRGIELWDPLSLCFLYFKTVHKEKISIMKSMDG